MHGVQQDQKMIKHDELLGKLERFGGLVEKASLFEMAMAGLGTIVSGFQADWIAYFLESFGELTENAFIAGKTIPTIIAAPMKLLGKALGIKNQSGTELKTNEDLMQAQEQLIGAINTTFSSASMLNIVFRTLPAVLRGKKPASDSQRGLLGLLSTKILPVINAGLMWGSAAGKRQLASAIQRIHYNGNRHQIDGAWASGIQDYYCGFNSFALMLRQVLNLFSPRIAHIAEPILAAWISGGSLKEGLHALKGNGDEEIPKYEFGFLDKSLFGNFAYGLAQKFAALFDLKLPASTELAT